MTTVPTTNHDRVSRLRFDRTATVSTAGTVLASASRADFAEWHTDEPAPTDWRAA